MEINWKKNTVLFLSGQALSIFGSMVVQYAILWHITLKTQSGTMMTVFTVAGFLPMFLISPFGGVWADRFNRKHLINLADGAIALASLIVAVLLMAGFNHVGILLSCAVVRSFGQGVQMPAVGALIPQIVPQEQLTRVNGIQGSVQSFTILISPAVSAFLMSFASLESLFFLDVLTAAAGISILFFFVKIPAVKKSGREQTNVEYFHDLKEGINYIRRHRFILLLMLLSAAFMFFATPSMLLTPLQVTRNFGNEVWRLSAIEITFSIGMMAGGFLIGAWGGFKTPVYTMFLACALFGLESIGFGVASVFWVYLGVMVITGVTVPLYNTPVMVLLQSSVEPDFMGRVLSVITMINSVMLPLGMLFFGPIADRFPINLLFVVTGVIMALLSIPFITSKTLRDAGKHKICIKQNLPSDADAF
ncbi:MAG: MFS transporter [Treponema sp.]|jgi:DHA3 family macrolide efflux protein-like MFS transporter|nr:MFS transporter [Treponema sp.]